MSLSIIVKDLKNSIMKKQFLILLTFCAMSWCVKAETEKHLLLMTEGNQLFQNEQWNDALKAYEETEKVMTAGSLQQDTLYYLSLAMQGRCYNKLNKCDKAIEYMQQAREAFACTFDTTTMDYANILDNLSFYCHADEQYKRAEAYSTQALAICYQLLTNSIDMRAILFHAAETKDALRKHDEAIALQQHALNIIADLQGEHHSDYVRELEYLSKYYRNAGKEEEAKATDKEIERLEEEREHGYVPALMPFDSAEKCLDHAVDAYYCSRYYLSHYLNAPRMNEAAQYIMDWTQATDLFSVNIGEPEMKWLNEKTTVFLIAYLAGNTLYVLENPENKNSLEQYSHGIVSMLNYYTSVKEMTGEVEAFEDYLGLYKKGEKQLFSRIEKDYKKFSKRAEKGETTKVGRE